MNKRTLMQHADLIKEQKKLKKRIEKLERQSTMVADVVQNGFKGHTVIYGVDIQRSDKLKKLYRTLKERQDKIVEQEAEIEEYINTIDRSDIRQILVHRYIENMNWLQIQTAMEYNCEDTARKKHDKFFEENL